MSILFPSRRELSLEATAQYGILPLLLVYLCLSERGNPFNHLVVGLNKLFSLDPMPAFDQRPLIVISHLMMPLFGPLLASALANSTLWVISCLQCAHRRS